MARPPRPHVGEPQTYGSVKNGSFWVEYPSGLVDLTCSSPVASDSTSSDPPQKLQGQLEVDVDGDRKIRIDASKTAIVIVDMQKCVDLCHRRSCGLLYTIFFSFFLHPDIRIHPLGLACVDPLLKAVPFLRKAGVRIIWL